MKSMIAVALLLTCAGSATESLVAMAEEVKPGAAESALPRGSDVKGGAGIVVTEEALRRCGFDPQEYASLSPGDKKGADKCVRYYEGVRLQQVGEIESFVGKEPEKLKRFINPESQMLTPEGLELLRSLARERASLSAPLKSAEKRLNLDLAAVPNFDGGIERPAANLNGNHNNKETDRVGPVLAAGAGLADAAAVFEFLDAARLGLGGGGGAASLGEQALAAAAAGDYSKAQELGDQASKMGDKALHAFHLGKVFTGIGGALIIAEGVRMMCEGINKALAGEESVFNETTAIGFAKVVAGIFQEISLAAPYFLIVGILLYGGAWIYQHRKAIEEFFINFWKWFKALFHKDGEHYVSNPLPGTLKGMRHGLLGKGK